MRERTPDNGALSHCVIGDNMELQKSSALPLRIEDGFCSERINGMTCDHVGYESCKLVNEILVLVYVIHVIININVLIDVSAC